MHTGQCRREQASVGTTGKLNGMVRDEGWTRRWGSDHVRDDLGDYIKEFKL